ncbi:MAG: YdeI/OmpD-associated family protein [Clostridia bacterium]|nr:YdeI/OmpD-associated family protein [Clostridia bacterium]
MEELLFKTRSDFRAWLMENHARQEGIWMVFGKTKALDTIKADDALEEALCFGWIDGQFSSMDDTKYLKKFTPRRKGSPWSERNKGIVAKLIEQGLMQKPGLEAIERAKAEGKWDMPKPEPISDEQVQLLINDLQGFEPALSNFMKMSPSVKRNYTGLYLDAKSEATRKKRLEKIVGRLNENKKPM